MAQTLLIGLGGTGSRVVNNTAKKLNENNKQFNDGKICCAVLDTNENDNNSIIDSLTGVPVIPTSKAQNIGQYRRDYHHLNIDEWCPVCSTFDVESMIDGASECRMKSRIAFMDCLESDVIRDLELMINEVLKNGMGSKIRVMIVSSLSGGTGSGMFIQVALWLRKFLSDCELMIRGIFLLPDVFIRTIEDIRNNKATQVRHRANAYAAIQELNTISKIRMGFMDDDILRGTVSLDKLFDSIKDNGKDKQVQGKDKQVQGEDKQVQSKAKPVYDFVFFIDYDGYRCVPLASIKKYEEMVAQLVYMQLFAPMKDDMRSEEDNVFLSFLKSEEPLYGSCGTARAVYPRQSVKTYCALRAAQDSITEGWGKIDIEIKALEDEIKQKEEDGIFVDERFDHRIKYISLFEEKTSVRVEEAGRDRFFISIADDVKNCVEHKSSDGKISVERTDKVEDFLKALDHDKIDDAVVKYSGTELLKLADNWVEAAHDLATLQAQIVSDEDSFENEMVSFEKSTDKYADAIVNSVFPYSMGDVRASNRCTIYGLLTKIDSNKNSNNSDKCNFVHPVAARYMLYKLVEALEDGKKEINLESSKQDVKDNKAEDIFDIKATRRVKEQTPTDSLNSVASKNRHNDPKLYDEFEKKYAEYITRKVGLCSKYETEILKVAVYNKLKDRVNVLIEELEAFFSKFSVIQEKFTTLINRNINETSFNDDKILYIYGDATAKEHIYKSLNVHGAGGNSYDVNKNIIESIYGRVCAEKRPSNPENQKYKNISVIAAFISGLVIAFRQRIDNNKNNSDLVNLDIYSALCNATDAELEIKQKEQEKRNREEGRMEDSLEELSSLDLETGKVNNDNVRDLRYEKAFKDLKQRLLDLAAPFLNYTSEVSKDDMGTVTIRPKVFWGFSPDIQKAYPSLDKLLGANTDLQADYAYPKNELYCYRAIYGLSIQYIPKFNESNDESTNYYTCYNSIISEVVKDFEGKSGERALVRTPHLDKNWHRILPALTEEKQKADALKFYRGLWLAVAYGMIRADKDGSLIIRRQVDIGFGDTEEMDSYLKYKNKKLTKTDLIKLFEVLQNDSMFMNTNIPELEKKLANELEDLVNYDTEVLNGLTPKSDILNPIDLICRYNELPKHNRGVTKRLINALESIALDLVKSYQVERSSEKLEKAKFKICKRIYDSSKRIKGKAEIFENWETKFSELNNWD